MTTYQPPALSPFGQQIADRQLSGARDQELAETARYMSAAQRERVAGSKFRTSDIPGLIVGLFFVAVVALCVLWVAQQYAPDSLTSVQGVADQFRALPAKYEAVRLSWDNLIHLRALTSAVGTGLNG